MACGNPAYKDARQDSASFRSSKEGRVPVLLTPETAAESYQLTAVRCPTSGPRATIAVLNYRIEVDQLTQASPVRLSFQPRKQCTRPSGYPHEEQNAA